MDQPEWTELPATHLAEGRIGILGVVLHDTYGNGSHDDTLYLKDPPKGTIVSSDFTVERNGSIWKLNPDLVRFYTHHAGRSSAWRGYQNKYVNKVTVGIELVQPRVQGPVPFYPLEQVRKSAILCSWLSTTFGFQPSEITTHRQVITDGSRSDPRGFPFDGQNGFWHHFWASRGQEAVYIASL